MSNRSEKCCVHRYIAYIVILAHLCPTDRCEITIITEGRHFMLAFPENFPNQCTFSMVLMPSLPADSIETFVNVNITVPALNLNLEKSVLLGASTTISLRDTSLSPASGQDVSRNNIIYVDVTVGKLSIIGSITCDSGNRFHRRSGEFLAVPVEFWGTRYVIMAPKQIYCGYTTTILTTSFKTTITVTFKLRPIKTDWYVYINGLHVQENCLLQLSPLARTEIIAVGTDITGTVLESNYPIGILVGPKNEAVLRDSFCSYDQGLFIEQLIPTYAWGKYYYITDGGVATSIGYRSDIRIIASLPNTTVYYNYIQSFDSQIRQFQNSTNLISAGSSTNFVLQDLFGFNMVASYSPIMVLIYTTATVGRDTDGALTQAVQFNSWPESVTLRLNSNLAQRIHIFTDTVCTSTLTYTTWTLLVAIVTNLDYGRQELELYIPSTGLTQTATQNIISVNKDVQGCSGISAFIMNDIGNDILSACPNFWSVECSDGQQFDIERKMCVEIQTSLTVTLTTSSQPGVVSSPISPQPSVVTSSASPQPSVVTLTTSPQPSVVTLTTSPQPSVVTSSASPQPSVVTSSTSSQPSDVTPPQPSVVTSSTSSQPSDVTSSKSPQPSDVTSSTSPQPSDVTSSPQPSVITSSTSPQSSDVTSSTNSQKSTTDTTVSSLDIPLNVSILSTRPNSYPSTESPDYASTQSSSSKSTEETPAFEDSITTTDYYTSIGSQWQYTTESDSIFTDHELEPNGLATTTDVGNSNPINRAITSTADVIESRQNTTVFEDIVTASDAEQTSTPKPVPTNITQQVQPDIIDNLTTSDVSNVSSTLLNRSVSTVQSTHDKALTTNIISLARIPSSASTEGNKTTTTALLDMQTTITLPNESKPPSPLIMMTRHHEISGTTTLSIETTTLSYESTAFKESIQDKMSPTKQCPCFCEMRSNKTINYRVLHVDDLQVLVSNLSRTKRLHTSAPDSRPVPVGIGVGAAIMFSCITLLLILPWAVDVKQSKDKVKMKYF